MVEFFGVLEKSHYFCAKHRLYIEQIFRHSKMRKSVKTAEKANLAYFVIAFRIEHLERVQ